MPAAKSFVSNPLQGVEDFKSTNRQQAADDFKTTNHPQLADDFKTTDLPHLAERLYSGTLTIEDTTLT